MAEEYKLSYTGKEIDERLGNAGNAVTHTAQTLTDEQKAQARANIGAAAVGEVGGTAEGTSDWNELANRPFYDNEDGTVAKQLDNKYLQVLETVVIQTDIIPEQELTFTLDESLGFYLLSGYSLFNVLALTVGETYHIRWGEETYVCTAYEGTYNGTPLVGIGNVAFIDGEDTGEPFAVGYFVADGTDLHNWCTIAAFDNSTSKNVCVYQTEEGYKLKESYLPDSLYTEIDTRIENYISEALGGDY